MTAKKFLDTDKLQAIVERQIYLAKELHTGANLTAQLKANYERVLSDTCTKHSTHDSTFYIQDCGAFGFRAIKFYNNTTDYRVGGFHNSMSEAYSDAICYL